MANRATRYPLEASAMALRVALEASFAPLREAARVTERIGLMRFRSPEDVAEIAKEIRAIAQGIETRMAQEEANGGVGSIRKGLQDLERRLRGLAE